MPAYELSIPPYVVVITGGPCSGKTELCRYLGRAFPDAVCIPEVATRLILSGKTPAALGLERFQLDVYRAQLQAEEQARSRGGLVVCDRGVADGFAYFPELSRRVSTSLHEALGRYDLAIQLEVIPDADTYLENLNNPARGEDHDAALRIEAALRRVYSMHPRFYFVTGTMEEKKARALRIMLEETGA
jgi:predicted ATPase